MHERHFVAIITVVVLMAMFVLATAIQSAPLDRQQFEAEVHADRKLRALIRLWHDCPGGQIGNDCEGRAIADLYDMYQRLP